MIPSESTTKSVLLTFYIESVDYAPLLERQHRNSSPYRPHVLNSVGKGVYISQPQIQRESYLW